MKKNKQITLAVLGLLLFGITSQAQTTPVASKALVQGKSGLHNNRIYWLNWDMNDDGLPGDDLNTGRTGTDVPIIRTFTTPAGFTYTIKLSNVKVYNRYGTDITTTTNGVLRSVKSNDWSGNNFPSAYDFDNERKNFYYLRNSNYMICGIETNFYSYFELKPNEILVYAYPYFKKGKKHKAKVKFYDASSKEFDISIDYKIIENQRNRYIMDY